jgi:hypothetical protein
MVRMRNSNQVVSAKPGPRRGASSCHPLSEAGRDPVPSRRQNLDVRRVHVDGAHPRMGSTSGLRIVGRFRASRWDFCDVRMSGSTRV